MLCKADQYLPYIIIQNKCTVVNIILNNSNNYFVDLLTLNSDNDKIFKKELLL